MLTHNRKLPLLDVASGDGIWDSVWFAWELEYLVKQIHSEAADVFCTLGHCFLTQKCAFDWDETLKQFSWDNTTKIYQEPLNYLINIIFLTLCMDQPMYFVILVKRQQRAHSKYQDFLSILWLLLERTVSLGEFSVKQQLYEYFNEFLNGGWVFNQLAGVHVVVLTWTEEIF